MCHTVTLCHCPLRFIPIMGGSIGFWFMHHRIGTVSCNRPNETRTINLPRQREFPADFPASSFTLTAFAESGKHLRRRRSCGHSTTRVFIRGHAVAARWRGTRMPPSLYFPSRPFVRRARDGIYRQLEFNYKHLYDGRDGTGRDEYKSGDE